MLPTLISPNFFSLLSESSLGAYHNPIVIDVTFIAIISEGVKSS
jgi:hypothetical protein